MGIPSCFFNMFGENIGGRVQKRPAFRDVFQTFCVRTSEAEYQKKDETQKMTAVAYALNSTPWIIMTSMRLSLWRMRLQRFSNISHDSSQVVEFKTDLTAMVFKHTS